MQTHYTNMTDTIGDEMSTIYMMWSFLSAFGSFISAWAIRESCDIMVGYYDITDSDEFDAYIELTGENFDINQKRGLFYGDLVHHTIMLISYGALAAGIQAGSFAYVYFSITGQEIDLSILDL